MDFGFRKFGRALQGKEKMVKLTCAALLILVAASRESLLILNQWQMSNEPYLLSFNGTEEQSSTLSNFSFDDGIAVKWACSAQINDKMYVLGGLPDDTDGTKTVFEVDGCGLKDTGIKLPYPLCRIDIMTKENSTRLLANL